MGPARRLRTVGFGSQVLSSGVLSLEDRLNKALKEKSSKCHSSCELIKIPKMIIQTDPFKNFEALPESTRSAEQHHWSDSGWEHICDACI